MTVAALINDPTVTAWIIVALYFLSAGAAFRARGRADSGERQFWLAVGLLLISLGLNKELDLQLLLTENARAAVTWLGLYEQRRLLQGVFLVVLAVGGILALILVVRFLRRSSGPAQGAAAGIVLLFAFVVLRAATFHHIDHWVTVDVAGLRSGWWLEIAGIMVIGISALVRGSARFRQQSR